MKVSVTEPPPTYRTENYFVDNWLNRVPLSQRYDYLLTKDIESIGTIVGYEPLYTNKDLSDHDPVLLTLS